MSSELSTGLLPAVGKIDSRLPIGIFDSGFGGLTVSRAVTDLLPHEDIIYLGDTARAPYGPRTIAEVRKFALEGLHWLMDQGVKALVVACNSASSAALRDIRERYSVPVVDVIIPAARRAAKITRNGRVGVISTTATDKSGAYFDALAASNVRLYSKPCPRFVEFVEEGITSGDEVLEVTREYLQPLKEKNVDTLILGCTHYPLLSGAISYVMGEEVALVSSSDECARSAFAILTKLEGLRDAEPDRSAEHRFFTTGDPSKFAGLGSRLVGDFVSRVEKAEL